VGTTLVIRAGLFCHHALPGVGVLQPKLFLLSFVADHWQYYSIIGVIALVVAAGEKVRRRMDKQRQHLATLFGVGVLLVLGVATWKRSAVYETDETLWRDTLAKNPRSWLARTNLAETQWRAGMAMEAYEHYQQALRIKPDYAPAHYDLGLILWQAGKTREAVEHWEQALRLEPGIADVHYTLGVALMQAGKTNEAMQHWEQAVRINPDDAEAHNDLGSALFGAGRIQEAIKHYEQALRIKPDYAEVHYNLGAALEQTGRLEEAIQQYERALQIKPDFAPAQNKLARLRTGR
jgi:Tfp pilus assembly protein PilF